MAESANDFLQGALGLLVLRALRDEARHGWGIQQRINQISRDALSINQGSLYPALVRLEKKGYVESEWGVSEKGRRARYYRLTKKGRKQLEAEQAMWREFSRGVEIVLSHA